MEKLQFSKIISLQFLRAFACLSVLFTHILQSLNIKPFGDYFISGGYGVDLFFILSGFLIYLTTKNKDSWKSFAVKRIFRIFPLYWFCTILFFIYGIFILNRQFTTLDYIQNIVMLPWNGMLTSKSLVVGVAWSTVYEIYFYVAFAVLLILNISKRYIIGLLILLFISFRIFYIFNIFELNVSRVFLFLYSVTGYHHIVPFIIGVVFAMSFQNPKVITVLYNLKNKKILFIMVHLLYFFID